MKIFLILSLLMSNSAIAGGFFDNLNGKLVYSSAQYHQHRAPRIDVNLAHSRTSSKVGSSDMPDGQYDLKDGDTKVFHAAILHRMSSSMSAMGLKLEGGLTNQKRNQSGGFQLVSQGESEVTFGSLTPFLAIDIGSHLTLGVETEFRSETSLVGSQEITRDSQTPLISLVAHGAFYEGGIVYRPTSRLKSRESDVSERINQTLVAHARLAFMYRLILGYARKVEEVDNVRLASGEVFAENRTNISSLEYFVARHLKVELIYSDGIVLSRDGLEPIEMTKEAFTAGIVYRNEGDSSFSLNATQENYESTDNPNQTTIAGTGTEVSASVQVKL